MLDRIKNIRLGLFVTSTLLIAVLIPQVELLFGSTQTPAKVSMEEISYSRDIKPLFSDRCYQCHGPDSESREGGFRLDDPESALGEADSGERPIVPGDPEASELFLRISLSSDNDEAMPPTYAHKPSLSSEEVERVKKWILAGAPFEKHWSFVAPTRPKVPTDPSGWAKTNIDQFIARGIQKHGLTPSPAADRSKLIRRVTLDLTGLPPTVEEVEAFLNDRSPDAYEKLVDRLLNSPRYGEHMARYWLDAVRYGDTHGLHLDNYREIWPYRDWVIESFNDNLKWDDFTIRQLAGDLLESPGQKDLIASGYNRLHVSTNEGGSIKEEVYVRNVVDRVSTTGSVFLGLSVGCAQCHDHKFDPISAEDFYSMFAFFNNLEAEPMDGNAKAHAPVLSIPTAESTRRLTEIAARMEELAKESEKPDPEFEAAFLDWQNRWHEKLQSAWSTVTVEQAESKNGTQLNIAEATQVITASGKNPDTETFEVTLKTDLVDITGIRLDALLGSNGLAGRAVNGNVVMSEFEAASKPTGGEGEFQKLRFVSADADYSQPNFPVSKAIDGVIDRNSGWAINGHQIKANRSAAFAAEQPFGFEGGTTIRVRLVFDTVHRQHVFQNFRFLVTANTDFGTHVATDWKSVGPFVAKDAQSAYQKDFGPESNVNLTEGYSYTTPKGKTKQIGWIDQKKFDDGKTHLFSDNAIGAHYLYREIVSPSERELTLSLGSDDAIRVWLNGEVVHENNVARGVAADQDNVRLTLKPGSNQLLIKIINFGGAAGFYYAEKKSKSLTPNLRLQEYLIAKQEQRTESQLAELKDFYGQSNPAWKSLTEEIAKLTAEKAKIESERPTTLIMKERSDPKPAYLLKRGQYDQPDKDRGAMKRSVPSFLPPLPESAPVNRLGFAQWLVTDQNPLMARVTVNRFWQQLMGSGIVATADDFGSQGTQPTHPELLDWLAVDFRENGWDVKRLVKQIVTTKTYQQDSTVSESAFKQDPKNLWLARGPRYRLDAEALRDQALAVSGLLVQKLGGPGVKPPQPAGLWKSVGYVGSNTSTFKADVGREKIHRRSIYTFWKRTSPPPQMSVFDAPTREECVVSRERTNNPLQALLLLNDPQYFEAARHLAERVLKENSAEEPSIRAKRMFYFATLRKATDEETNVLKLVYEQQLSVFQKDAAAAKQLLTVGAFDPPTDVDLAELAAWTMAANVVLNLDELINKQ